MSVWSSATGSVVIRKDSKVSIKKVIEDTLTDEFRLDIKTTEFKEGMYIHEIEMYFEMDGFDFCRAKDNFFKSLKAESIDLTFELRFLG